LLFSGRQLKRCHTFSYFIVEGGSADIYFPGVCVVVGNRGAVACVVYGFDVYRSIPQKLNENKEVFINDWIICVVNATEHSFEFIKTIYDKIGMLHSKLDYLEKKQKERYFISTLNPLQTDNTNSNEKKQT
jgi:hypothetical protein